MPSLTASVLGFDPLVLRKLDQEMLQGLRIQVASTFCGCATTGWASFAAARALGSSTWIAIVACGGATLFIWNLFRLHNAGSGIALHATDDESARWRPRIGVPIAVFCFLSAILAQAAHVSLRENDLRPVLERHRMRLSMNHERSVLAHGVVDIQALRSESAELQARSIASDKKVQALAEDEQAMQLEGVRGEHRALVAAAERAKTRLTAVNAKLTKLEYEVELTRRTEVEPYTEHINDTPFPALSIVWLWNAPEVATAFTLVFMMLMASPLITRALAPASIRAYETLRSQRDRALVVREFQRTNVEVKSLLERDIRKLPYGEHDLARRQMNAARYADAPFNRVPVESLYQSAATATPEELLAAIEGRDFQ